MMTAQLLPPNIGCSFTTTPTAAVKPMNIKRFAQEIISVAQESLKFTEAYRRDDFPDSMVVQINYKQYGFNQYYGVGSAKYYKPESRWALVELSYRNNQWIVIRQKNGSFD